MPVTLDILSGEEDLSFDLTLDLPVKFPQVDPLPLIPILTPNTSQVLFRLTLTISKSNYCLARWRPDQRPCCYFCSFSCNGPCGKEEKKYHPDKDTKH